MDQPEERIAELQMKAERIHYEFVRTELAGCSAAVESGIRELESGNSESAQEEAHKAEKGYKAIVGFIAELGDEGQRAEIEKLWNSLRMRLDTLQTMIKGSVPE